MGLHFPAVIDRSMAPAVRGETQCIRPVGGRASAEDDSDCVLDCDLDDTPKIAKDTLVPFVYQSLPKLFY